MPERCKPRPVGRRPDNAGGPGRAAGSPPLGGQRQAGPGPERRRCRRSSRCSAERGRGPGSGPPAAHLLPP